MKVSQILITYNHEDFIGDCLSSILESKYDPFELFIWDNCSTDHTPDLINSIIADYKGPHSIQFHRSDYNYHPSFTPLNTAMERVNGDYIVFISGDDYQAPQRIARTTKFLKDTAAKAVSASAYLIDHNGQITGQLNRLEENASFKRFSTARDFAAIPGSPVCFGAALAWHRSVFDVFGPLREGPRNADVMIPFRGALLGGNYYIEEPLVYRRLHEDNISLPQEKKNAESEEQRMLIKERQLANRLANFVRMTEDAEAFARAEHPHREILVVADRMREQTMRICSRWVKHRSAMAKAGIGIV